MRSRFCWRGFYFWGSWQYGYMIFSLGGVRFGYGGFGVGGLGVWGAVRSVRGGD